MDMAAMMMNPQMAAMGQMAMPGMPAGMVPQAMPQAVPQMAMTQMAGGAPALAGGAPGGKGAQWLERWSPEKPLAYCQMHQIQRYDPGAHDEGFLGGFFAALSSGQINTEQQDTPQKQELVNQVKGIQKSSPECKQMWYDFCSRHGNTNYDPARHDEKYLSDFVDLVNKGGYGTGDAPISNKIFVGALEKTASEDDVKEFFSNFGTVTLVELKLDLTTGVSRGFAFVSFADEGPVKFILDNKEMMKMNGKQIDCKPARDRPTWEKGGGGGYGMDWMGGGKGWGKDYGKMGMMMAAMMGMMKGGKGGGGGCGGKGKDVKGQQYGKGMGPPTADSEVVFVGGLPKDATEEAIAQHFSQFGIVQKVDMKYDMNTGVFRGFAFVTLGAVEQAQAVMSNYDNNMFNGRWIDCKPAALGKMQEGAVSVPPQNIPIEKVGPAPTNAVLRLRGMPFSASKEQVEQFFAGYGLSGRVHLKQDFSGRPSGEAFAEFVSTEEAVRAFNEKNFQMMGTRYIELMGASDNDVQTYLVGGGAGAKGGYGPMKGGCGKGPSPYDMMSSFFGY
ncbi:unnamed protein product [Effrenium voratum]|uniref:RRM domain-containing protein n=1 Tax=Effrenium voratum TaxID=2562239 RepID=A0AA36J6B9_9DINO|nr:unnamed protein product [Effrenium voratum]